jgi:hypothetical protein
MANSKSLLAYPDVQEVFDRAIASEKGVVLRFGSVKERDRFMYRCFTFRTLDRKNNIVLYPEAHTMHGRSIYDTIALFKREKDGTPTLVFEKIELKYLIEDIA